MLAMGGTGGVVTCCAVWLTSVRFFTLCLRWGLFLPYETSLAPCGQDGKGYGYAFFVSAGGRSAGSSAEYAVYGAMRCGLCVICSACGGTFRVAPQCGAGVLVCERFGGALVVSVQYGMP